MYRFQGKARRLTLGRYPALTVAQAHSEHGKAMEQLEKGIDPGAVEVEARRQERKAPTVTGLVDEYLEKWAKPRKRTWEKDESMLRRDVIPEWGRRKAKEITRRDVVLLLDKIVDRGAPIQANRTLQIVRKMFNFALSRDIVQVNPCQQVRAPAAENQRDRVLSADEIQRLWEALDSAGLEPTDGAESDSERLSMAQGTALALKFQLVTAQRKGEVASAAWSEIDLDSKMWTIPVEKSKNKLPHRVPLTDLALQLLEEIKSLSCAGQEETEDSSPWLFPSPRGRGKQHILETAIDRAVRNNREAIGIPYWVPHDLRRTAASMMTSIGVSRLTVSKILNHVERGVTATYDRHSYDTEKRKALEAWSRKLGSMLSADSERGNVISLT